MRNATRKRHRPGLPYNEPPTAGAELSSSAVVLEHCRRVPATTLPHTRPEVPGCDFRSKHIPKVKRRAASNASRSHVARSRRFASPSPWRLNCFFGVSLRIRMDHINKQWLWLRSPNPMWQGVSKRSNDLTKIVTRPGELARKCAGCVKLDSSHASVWG